MATQTVVREAEVQVNVVDVVKEADGVVSLHLAAQDGESLPPWTPGAHIDLVMGDGLIRQYSLCGSATESKTYRIGILLSPESRGGSQFVHDNLHEGASLTVRGPRNHFSFAASAKYLFIAGGIGITPMLPMIAEAEEAGRDWELFYGGRSRDSMAFLDELAAYGDRVTVVPQDEAGHLDLPEILREPRPNTLVYGCGPEGMLNALEEQCGHWPSGSLHLERFTAKEQDADATDTAFELVLERSGQTLQVGADQSVFEVVREAGVSVLGSCLEGICGTCETEVISGDLDHRDSVLDPEERESGEVMMICVSRCRSARLTLDL
ncbi:PDR/VanB family oxidoreductase [Ornithinimicrobium sp. INDO-MA30-4]|uniref:PDR/VanB family oxidoreductase n=1 Tax=Ornithinimicrobium sp. INDO-MA30-4 TaxID=2908651 RepID=UPI001F40C2CC|nr:PDR/VanB family oxidoreductase [Ornithinimicrobium sp. INDO-MA30-4]UJH70834.1 PDR/VanB family oxidoreductase [Ornithinimicrobium sp. INDO-MA30-4]